MLRFLIYSLIFFLLMRALTRFWRGVQVGMNGGTAPPRDSRAPQRGVQMARDPVCGTFIVPARAVVLSEHGETLHFCSIECRDRYRAQAGAHRPTAAAGRTA